MVTRSTLLNCTPIQFFFILSHALLIMELYRTQVHYAFITMGMLNDLHRNWNFFIASPTMVAMSMPLMPHTLQSHLLHFNRLRSTSRHDWRMLCEAVLLSCVGRVHAQDYFDEL